MTGVGQVALPLFTKPMLFDGLIFFIVAIIIELPVYYDKPY
jgi:hypothetical protein